MVASRFLLVHPDVDAHPSGGNQFNRRVLREAHSRGWLLGSLIADPAVPVESADAYLARRATTALTVTPGLIVWDSLFLGVAPPQPRDDAQQALLMHFLPSLNPLLSGSPHAAARIAEDRWFARMDCVIATGRCLENLVTRRYPAVRVYRCEPGVDGLFGQVRRCEPRVPGDVAGLLSVGNLIAAKGYGEVLEALSRLSSANWRWHIVGSDRLDASFAAGFLERAGPLIRQGRIVCHGVLSQIELARLMSQVDVFVSASHYESFGMALAEAVAAGLMVVATDVGDAVYIAQNATSAWLVPQGDSMALTAALTAAISVPAKGRSGGGSTACCHFPDWSDVFARFRGICETQVGLAPGL